MSQQGHHPQREQNKDKKTGKSPRMQCTICGKPAVRYYTTRYSKDGKVVSRTMVYEHRDEPPIRDYIYRNQKYPRYRRCNAGIVKGGLPLMQEPKEEEQQRQLKPRPEQQQEQQESRHEEKDYLAEMIYTLKELDEISHDISGEESKRILKNIWRWLAEKRQELRKQNE